MAKSGLHISIKKLLLLGFLFVVLLIIPLTIYLVQQQQDSRSQATANTTMKFTPDTTTAQVGDDVSFDVMIVPGNNQVNFIKLVVKFDSTKLKATNTSFVVDPNSNLSILQGPVVGTDTISVALSVGNDPTKVIQADTKIGTLTFNVIDGPAENSQITFDPATEVSSINGGNNDAFNENVFLSGTPASLTITDGTDVSPTPDPNLSPEPTIRITSGGENVPPVCNSLTPSGSLTGEAPYDLSFTVNGTDSDGTLRNFKFTFEPNEFINIASTAANAKSIATVTTDPHTYETAGSFTASVIITDDQGGTGSSVACTKSITITDDNADNNNDNSDNNDDDSDNNTLADENSDDSGATTTSTDNSDEDSEIVTTEESPSPMPATGPGEALIGIGALGGILLLIGTLLFFAL